MGGGSSGGSFWAERGGRLNVEALDGEQRESRPRQEPGNLSRLSRLNASCSPVRFTADRAQRYVQRP